MRNLENNLHFYRDELIKIIEGAVVSDLLNSKTCAKLKEAGILEGSILMNSSIETVLSSSSVRPR
jgi:hypothetical protein